jgi:DNA-binding HxlR family transcriptional regulator
MLETIRHNTQECISLQRSLQDTLYVINGKWKILILATLMDKPYRFKELSRELGISPRMLSKELTELEMNDLVTRKVIETKPAGVEYAATDYGKTLSPVLQALSEWGKKHRERITGH